MGDRSEGLKRKFQGPIKCVTPKLFRQRNGTEGPLKNEQEGPGGARGDDRGDG